MWTPVCSTDISSLPKQLSQCWKHTVVYSTLFAVILRPKGLQNLFQHDSAPFYTARSEVGMEDLECPVQSPYFNSPTSHQPLQ